MSRNYQWYRNSQQGQDGEYYITRGWTLNLDLNPYPSFNVGTPVWTGYLGPHRSTVHPLRVQLVVYIGQGKHRKATNWYGHISVEHGSTVSLFEKSRRCTSVKNVMNQLDEMDLEGMARDAIRSAIKPRSTWYKKDGDTLVPIMSQIFGYTDYVHTYTDYPELYYTCQYSPKYLTHYKRSYCGYSTSGTSVTVEDASILSNAS